MQTLKGYALQDKAKVKLGRLMPSEKQWILIVQLSMAAYILLRAGTVAITYDEAWSWYDASRYSWQGIVLYTEYTFANNHVLNSCWIKLNRLFLGDYLIVMRLPSVLGLVLYLYCSYQLLKENVEDVYIRVLGYLLLVCNPFVVDFFSLARGYGLSMGLLSGSIWQLSRFIYRKQRKYLYGSYILGLVSAISNLAFTYFLLALLFTGIVLQLHMWRQTSSIANVLKKAQYWLIEAVVVVVILAYLLPISKKVVAYDPYLIGTQAGFMQGTVATLVKATLYDAPYPKIVATLYKLLLQYSVIPLLLFAVFRVRKFKRGDARTFLLSAVAVLGSIIIIMHVQYFLRGVPYPKDRGALYLFPLVSIISILLIDGMGQSLLYAMFGGVCAFLFMHFLLTANLTYTYAWKNEAFTDQVVAYLRSNGRANPGVVRVWTDDQSYALEYYVSKEPKPQIEIARHPAESIVEAYDYYYVSREVARVLNKSSDLEVVEDYVQAGRMLLKKSNR